MAALTPVTPDKAEVLSLVEAVLAWDVSGSNLPELEESLGLFEQFTAYGRVVAEDLRTLCVNVPAESGAGRSVRATLGESGRRLYLPAPTTRRSAACLAQNLARLVQALNRATGVVGVEQAKARSGAPRAPV
ncbi:DUF6415 family natural product biosynthesis protein [Streptomyces sp. NPDC020883]|uniref:DUF6415 family natural product biosynthesis protein n=1 Tax=Streptomyces sp. NPDC020883 TaxID=3365099 RepID=UPI00378B2349